MKEHEWFRTLTSVEVGKKACELHVCKSCGLTRTAIVKQLPCPPWIPSGSATRTDSDIAVLRKIVTKLQAAAVLSNDNEDSTQGDLLQSVYEQLDRFVSIADRRNKDKP